MALRRGRNLVVGLWGVALALVITGCGRSGGVSFQASGERWHFVQDEKRLLFYGGTASTSALDVDTRRTLWEHWFSTRAWLAVSASGSHVVVVDQVTPAADARLTVLRAADGTTVMTAPIGPWQHTFEKDEAAFLALSFDGSWVAVAGGTAAEKLILRPVPTGDPVLFHEDGHSMGRLSFDPHRLRLAVTWSTQWLDLYENTDGTWRRTQRWSDAHCPVWTDRGLAFASRDGYHVFEGGRDVAFVHADLLEGACDTWRFSPDAAWLLRWSDWELTVASATTGATSLQHEWEKKQPPGLCGIAISGNRLRVFTCTGLLFQFDLATMKITRKDDFGTPAVFGRDIVGPASRVNYTPGLSPSGDWIVMWKPSGVMTLYR
jgi:hypothetical protein